MGENRVILWLASILSFRMLGLFMIYPVFAVYAPQFKYANPTLIGIALGSYGLTQALFQLPLGMLSDRLGRKPIIIGGLLILGLGSILCALSNNIYLLIIGRALQGAGAIGSTVMAYAADLTTPKNRTKTMALLGITIGLSFALSLVLGPLINSLFHLTGIFWLTAIFACLGLLIQTIFIPESNNISPQQSQLNKKFLLNPTLIKLNFSILTLHAIFTATFLVLPLLFSELVINSSEQWKIYLSVLGVALLFTLPLLQYSEKKNHTGSVMLVSILTIAIAEYLLFSNPASKNNIIIALTIFFMGFTLLEALLPALISKVAPAQARGGAMGIYSTSQFLGIFLGGTGAGLLRSHYGNHSIFLASTLLCVLWLFVAYERARKPTQHSLNAKKNQ